MSTTTGKTAATYLAEAGGPNTPLAQRTACAAVNAFTDQWKAEHGGREPDRRVAGALGRAVKNLVDRGLTHAQAEQVVIAARGSALCLDLWGRAVMLLTGERPLPQDAIVAAQQTLELLADGRPWDRVVWAVEMAGTHGEPWVAAAYAKVARGAYQCGLDALERARTAAAIRADGAGRGLTLTPAEVEVAAFRARYGLPWAPAPLPTPTDLAIARADEWQAAREAEAEVAAAAWDALTDDERATWTRQALLARGWGGRPWLADSVLTDAQRMALEAHSALLPGTGPVGLIGRAA